MIEILLAVLFGIFIGSLCGLLPGLHPNTTIPLIMGLVFLFDPLTAAIILISAGVSNSFLSFIPAILLGAPEDDTALSILPGHKLLLQGRGYEAIKLTVVGGIASIFFIILTLPLFVSIIPKIYFFIRPYMHFLLIFIVLYMVFKEKRKFYAILVFVLSGLLGLISFNSGNFLFSLLSGLFGLPLLLMSIKKNTKLPDDISFETEPIERRNILSGISIGSLSGILAGLLPGIGSAQACVLAQEITGKKDEKTFLMAIGSINTVDIIYSLFAIWLIGNPRSGIAVAVETLMEVGLKEILLFLCVITIVSGISVYLTLKLSKKALVFLKKINYKKLCFSMFLMILVLVFLLSGLYGLFISLTALSIGLIPSLIGINRSHCMGCLLLPTILFFSGIVL